jgi:hypothetical protein
VNELSHRIWTENQIAHSACSPSQWNVKITWEDQQMNRQTYEQEKAKNQQAYHALRTEIRRAYAGQYVALAGGQLITAAPTFDEARAAVEQLRPVPEYYLVFPADIDPAFDLVYDL